MLSMLRLPEWAGTLRYYKDAIQIVKGFLDGYTKKFDRSSFIHQALRWRW